MEFFYLELGIRNEIIYIATQNFQIYDFKEYGFRLYTQCLFWCGKVFERGQVTFLIYFENAVT